MKSYTSVLIAMVFLFGCSFSAKNQSTDQPPAPLTSLQVTSSDWTVGSVAGVPVSHVTKVVKPEKIDYLRKNFRMPTLTSVTVPESNGFEIYRIHGYPELEASAYIHPKLFIHSAMEQGSILGYRTGSKDQNGNDLIEISIPVALVNGLVPTIPHIGGAKSGTSSAVTLPASYRIEQPGALKEAIGTDLSTLPMCPRFFRLGFEGKEYVAQAPFENLSSCPLNQFFRIKIQAPAQEMKRLLDTAATREEAVTLIADLEAAFEYPTKRVDVSVEPGAFHAQLAAKLHTFASNGFGKKKEPIYGLANIETAIEETLFEMASKASLHPQIGKAFGRVITEIILSHFSAPIACAESGVCRSLAAETRSANPIAFGWLETESLGSPLRTQTLTSLGSVANSSRFVSKPSRDQLQQVRRPKYFEGIEFGEIIKQCIEIVAGTKVTPRLVTALERKEVDAFCRTVAENSARNDNDPHQTDGFFPLGNNTVVYPGAWLRLDIDDISEFTTAKTRTGSDGSVQVESEVVDLLADQPTNKRTSCINGGAAACQEYQKIQIPIRCTDGSQQQDKISCPKSEEGKDGCRCEKATSGEEACFRAGNYLFQEIKATTCDPGDEFAYCPYWRSEEQVIDYEIEYECHDIKIASQTNFLCISGCTETHEIQCKEKTRKPVKVVRQVLNCIEDELERIEELKLRGEKEIPERKATAYRVRDCRRPKYKCAKWETSCTHYAVNEVFHIIHEEPAPKWRPFSIDQGEFPARFEDDIYLKFVSKAGQVATNCRLSAFARELRGSTIFIKVPTEANETKPCDLPIWDSANVHPTNLPKVYIKNAISYPERRLCGKTEYSFLTKELPLLGGDGLVPSEFNFKTIVNIGPIRAACLAPHPFEIGRDLWFTEHSPVRFSGRVSVLGRMLESILTEMKQ
jgi:hypothetical protein